MSDSLTDLILSLTPEDGTTIGNGSIIALLREQLPGLHRVRAVESFREYWLRETAS